MISDTESEYLKKALAEYEAWCKDVTAEPSAFNATARGFQRRLNNLIPDSIHQLITKTIRQVTSGVIRGAGVTTIEKERKPDFPSTENYVRERISFYASSSAAEGAITGFGGFISGLADFPLWMALKMKMLFEIAYAYGMDVDDYRERLYILYIFQLTFSSQKRRREIFPSMQHWDRDKEALPESFDDFDWKTFQLEYRDHIDLAKLIQLIPGVGAIAGAMVNHKYTLRLGEFAVQSYRMRMKEFNGKK